MFDAITNVPVPVNEPIRSYAPGSPERAVLENRVKELAGERAELTMAIGGEHRMGAGERVDIVQPHNHRHVLGQLGTLTNAVHADATAAIEAAMAAKNAWAAMPFDERAAVFLRAAALLADPSLATATGGYYSSAKLKKSSKKSRDHDAQDRVYEQTERELRIHN